MSLQLPTKAYVSAQVLFQQLDGEYILLNLDNENYYSLDSVGSRAWELLAQSSDLEQVVSTLLAEYKVDEATLRADLASLFDDMVQAGLITVEP
jgi:hypothetical protein